MKFLYIGCLTLFLTMMGCQQSFLDTAPSDKIVTSTFYQTADDAVMAVNAIYQVLATLHNHQYDDVLVATSDNAFGNEDIPQLSSWTFQSNDPGITNLWQRCYEGILYANTALKYIPGIEMDNATKNNLLGQAHFLRGLYYLLLVNNFGRVPLILEPLTVETMEVPREETNVVYDQIISDFEFARTNLVSIQDIRGTNDLGRATAEAAAGYLARTYMWLENWESCAKYAKEVISSGLYGLEADYAMVFHYSNKNNKESLFEVQYASQVPGAASFDYSCWNSPRGNDRVSCGYGHLMTTQSLIDAYEPGDLRRPATIFIEGDDFFGVPYDPSLSNTGSNPVKWLVPIEEATAGNTPNRQLMRYAEVLLMYAEAQFHLGEKTEALNAINEIRNRAGLDNLDISELDLNAIYKERRIELAFEGHRLGDLRRTGMAESLLNAIGKNYQSFHNVFPIPSIEMDANSALAGDQNPGYN